MKTSFGTWLSALAICGLALPVTAAEPVKSLTVTDVALTPTGTLLGAVVDSTGTPLAKVPIRVLHGKTVVASAKTDATGRYSVTGLRRGVHVVQTNHYAQPCRLWDAVAAPPSAKRGLVMTGNATVVRGQFCDDGCGQGSGQGCGEGCGSGGGGLFGGAGLFGSGAILPIAAFAAVGAVTLASATRNEKSSAGTPPASP